MNLANMADQIQASTSSMELGITIKCFTEVGKLIGLGKVIFQAQEIIDLDAQTAVHGALISIETSGEYPSNSVSVIGYDNIDKACAAIDKIKLIDPKSSKFKSIEARFTVDGLTIMVFNVPGKDAFVPTAEKLMFSVSSGNCSAFFEISKISELKLLLIKARETIDACKHTST
ncbi:hypothetical protein [Methylobacterium planeticum]|uniref:Uncharacterized protein n=1 Tax=Methylobacterium planeticum TaxID=2615211 RepID=A0A6N6MIF0_9HYPH|nr:hypothetical protein [Methylobacterium planeticum]KAB1068817.1 hypothetical protein F6X51_26240 [Methylobacterium planeticum]